MTEVTELMERQAQTLTALRGGAPHRLFDVPAELRARIDAARAFPDDPDRPDCEACGDAGYVVAYRRGSTIGPLVVCACKRAEVIAAARRASRLEHYPLFGGMRLGTFDTSGAAVLGSALATAREYAAAPAGLLTLSGKQKGAGKTHLAVAIAWECAERGESVAYWSVPDLLDHLRSAFHADAAESYDSLYERARSVRLLVLDDLGADTSTAWAWGKVGQLVDHRYRTGAATVITTNLSLAELGAVEDRIASRLMGGRGVVLEGVPDYRLTARGRALHTEGN